MQFGVTPQELDTESAHVRTGAGEVEAVLNRLGTEITNLASNWTGPAYDAFLEHWHTWQTGAQQVKASMEDMATFLSQAAQKYEANEHDIANAARG